MRDILIHFRLTAAEAAELRERAIEQGYGWRGMSKLIRKSLGLSTRNEKARAPGEGKLIRDLIAMVKNAPCYDCGKTLEPRYMHFDHRDGSAKKVMISQIHGRPLAEVRQELAKCDLVCLPCHTRRTTQRRLDSKVYKADHTPTSSSVGRGTVTASSSGSVPPTETSLKG